jgi:uridylate kinase
VLLKISGESLAGESGQGIDADAVEDIARKIAESCKLGVEIGLVVGGGNLIRGALAAKSGIDRSSADYMGMLSTVINSIALSDALAGFDQNAAVLSSIEVPDVAEIFTRRRAFQLLKQGYAVLFAGGTGNPYFSTDTAASLRACQISANAVLKGTKVDGVYDSDPVTNPDAQFFRRLTYTEVLHRNLEVMDSTAVALCMQNELPIVVFNLWTEGNIKKALLGQDVGTTVAGRGI